MNRNSGIAHVMFLVKAKDYKAHTDIQISMHHGSDPVQDVIVAVVPTKD